MTDGATDTPLGVSAFLPRFAADILVNAANRARQLKEGSFERRRVIEDAIVAVKTGWPEFFGKAKRHGPGGR